MRGLLRGRGGGGGGRFCGLRLGWHLFGLAGRGRHFGGRRFYGDRFCGGLGRRAGAGRGVGEGRQHQRLAVGGGACGAGQGVGPVLPRFAGGQEVFIGASHRLQQVRLQQRVHFQQALAVGHAGGHPGRRRVFNAALPQPAPQGGVLARQVVVEQRIAPHPQAALTIAAVRHMQAVQRLAAGALGGRGLHDEQRQPAAIGLLQPHHARGRAGHGHGHFAGQPGRGRMAQRAPLAYGHGVGEDGRGLIRRSLRQRRAVHAAGGGQRQRQRGQRAGQERGQGRGKTSRHGGISCKAGKSDEAVMEGQ